MKIIDWVLIDKGLQGPVMEASPFVLARGLVE